MVPRVRPNVASPRFQGWDQKRPVYGFGAETKCGSSTVTMLEVGFIVVIPFWVNLYVDSRTCARFCSHVKTPFELCSQQTVHPQAGNSASSCPDFLLLWMSSQIYTCSPVGVASRPAGFVLVPAADNMNSAGHKWSSIFVLAALARFVLVSIPTLQLDLNGYY